MKYYFCIIQEGYGVFGLGENLSEVVEDANNNLNSEDRIYYDEIEKYNGHGDGRHNLKWCRCTKSLYNEVQLNGGDIPYIWDGDQEVLDLC